MRPSLPALLSALAAGLLAVVLTGCSAGTDAPAAAPATLAPATSAPTTSAPGAQAPTAESTTPAPVGTVLELTYEGGAAGGPDTGRPAVAAGQPVTVRITSDVVEEVHVHGVDLYVDLVAGDTTEIVFDAPPPGVYEVEAHDTGVVLARMEVR